MSRRRHDVANMKPHHHHVRHVTTCHNGRIKSEGSTGRELRCRGQRGLRRYVSSRYVFFSSTFIYSTNYLQVGVLLSTYDSTNTTGTTRLPPTTVRQPHIYTPTSRDDSLVCLHPIYRPTNTTGTTRLPPTTIRQPHIYTPTSCRDSLVCLHPIYRPTKTSTTTNESQRLVGVFTATTTAYGSHQRVTTTRRCLYRPTVVTNESQ
jgi:hypothetical protein